MGSKINAITSAYAKQLGPSVQKTDVRAQKNDSSLLKTFEIVIADFQIEDKLGKIQFFQESFLVADTNMEVGLGILFLNISNADI